MKSKVNYSLISLGCARTLVDSESISNKLNEIGFNLVQEESNETVTILNTCSFIQAAIDETERNIATLIDRKNEGRIKHLAVIGCYPSRFKKEILSEKFPEVDLWLTTQEQSQMQKKLSQLVFKKRFSPKTPSPYTKLTPSHYAYLKISEGCNNWCAFCTIPKIRGEHTSKPLEKIIEEAKKQIRFGAKELILIAEDTTAWGEDLYGEPSFPLLLEKLAELPVDWIRPMYIFPSRVDSRLIQVIKAHENICNYIDIPIQHVNDTLLESMNRRHDRAFLDKILNEFRETVPDIALRTTFIIGYPGETEEMIDELIDFIEQHPFEQLGCFAYSEERETRAFKIPNKVAPDVIQARIERVMERQYELVSKRNQAKVGQRFSLLYEGDQVGRLYCQAPDVDGHVVLEDVEGLEVGEFYQAKITSAKGYDIQAQCTD